MRPTHNKCKNNQTNHLHFTQSKSCRLSLGKVQVGSLALQTTTKHQTPDMAGAGDSRFGWEIWFEGLITRVAYLLNKFCEETWSFPGVSKFMTIDW